MTQPVKTAKKDTSVQQTDTLSASARKGKTVLKKYECLSCHTIDGAKELAPPFKGLFGSRRELAGGSVVIADEGYIKDSIQYPGNKIALGYNENMPSYRDLMTEQELQAVTDYIKALR